MDGWMDGLTDQCEDGGEDAPDPAVIAVAQTVHLERDSIQRSSPLTGINGNNPKMKQSVKRIFLLLRVFPPDRLLPSVVRSFLQKLGEA